MVSHTPRWARKFYEEVVVPYEGDECIDWPFNKAGNGYAVLRYQGRKTYVTRLLLGVPPFEGAEAAHSCGRGRHGCVTKRHLSWKTRKDNIADRYAHDTISFRHKGWRNTKLTSVQFQEIGASAEPYSVLMERYGVSRSTVYRAKKTMRRNWE